ncbi:hypothetical protein KIPB_004800 [Kipferlia bialata]|uniref:Uncharacterized protein n=1 Tax=Kipferlia bialata TaxID=797122 RepID=A0A9K3GI20_9EUKA|nr:hypothetical protein KIPB_004800 [Kipferlia bialata]|eukprot:g4800.t1
MDSLGLSMDSSPTLFVCGICNMPLGLKDFFDDGQALQPYTFDYEGLDQLPPNFLDGGADTHEAEGVEGMRQSIIDLFPDAPIADEKVGRVLGILESGSLSVPICQSCFHETTGALKRESRGGGPYG